MLGHFDIQDDEIGLFSSDHFDESMPAVRSDDLITVLFQLFTIEHADDFFIVDD